MLITGLIAAFLIVAFLLFRTQIIEYFDAKSTTTRMNKIKEYVNYLHEFNYFENYGNNTYNKSTGVVELTKLNYCYGYNTLENEYVLRNLTHIFKADPQIMYLYVNFTSQNKVSTLFTRNSILNATKETIDTLIDNCASDLIDNHYEKVPNDLRYSLDTYVPKSQENYTKASVVDKIFHDRPTKETVPAELDVIKAYKK